MFVERAVYENKAVLKRKKISNIFRTKTKGNVRRKPIAESGSPTNNIINNDLRDHALALHLTRPPQPERTPNLFLAADARPSVNVIQGNIAALAEGAPTLTMRRPATSTLPHCTRSS